MSVIVNEIKREVTRTEVVGRTYTITLSEREAALVLGVLGAQFAVGARAYFALKKAFPGWKEVARHRPDAFYVREDSPFGAYLAGLSDEAVPTP